MDGRAVSCGGSYSAESYPGIATGPAGPQGTQGPQGDPGPAGPAGPAGATGYGIVGGGSDLIMLENDIVATTSYTITVGKNALTAGPLTVNSGVTITVPSGSTWAIV